MLIIIEISQVTRANQRDIDYDINYVTDCGLSGLSFMC
jgi:hypothetical protein